MLAEVVDLVFELLVVSDQRLEVLLGQSNILLYLLVDLGNLAVLGHKIVRLHIFIHNLFLEPGYELLPILDPAAQVSVFFPFRSQIHPRFSQDALKPSQICHGLSLLEL